MTEGWEKENFVDRFESYKNDFARDGYVIARNVLSPQEVAELDQNLSRYIDQIVPGLPPADVFYETNGSPETLEQMQFMHSNDGFFAKFLHR